jgi:quercetin dioxygenase-like cupin family protein
MKRILTTIGRQRCAVALSAIIALTAPAALATDPAGIVPAPETMVLARGSFADQTDIKLKIKGARGQEVINVSNAQQTVVQKITIAPGGHTGWHSHPGPVVVVIHRGIMSFYDSEDPTCTVRRYTAGQAFVDSGQGHVHIARNEGSENLVLLATYFDVPVGQHFRIDAPNPGTCAF